MKTILKIFGILCTAIVVYLLAFIIIAAIFHAEHWTFVLAMFPAALSTMAMGWAYND